MLGVGGVDADGTHAHEDLVGRELRGGLVVVREMQRHRLDGDGLVLGVLRAQGAHGRGRREGHAGCVRWWW
jgi:hypothetical protein